MSTVGGGVNIVTNGLVLCYDPANTKSFLSGSTFMYDLTKNNYTSSLVNGPTYSGDAMGSISLDLTDDRIEFPNLGNLTDGTVSIWFKNNSVITTATTNAFIFEFTSASTLTIRSFSAVLGNVSTGSTQVELLSVNLWSDVSNLTAYYTASNLPITGSSIPIGWHNLVVARDSVGTRVYFNNTLLGTPSLGVNIQIIPTSSIPFISSSWLWNANKIGRILGGMVSHFSVYNRGISTQEVNINYNVLKKRFGL